MDALYHQTNRLAEGTQARFAHLERAIGEDAVAIEVEIQNNIDTIFRNCDRLEVMVMKEPPSRRATSKMRVDQLLYDSRHLQAALKGVRVKREAKERELREREELLGRRFAPNDQGDTSIMIDHALQHHTSLQSAHRGVDDLLGSGQTILSSLREQRSSLKGVHRKMLDLANTLGLSNSVIRMIEKRAYQDKFILFGGMLFTSVFMFLLWKYFG